MNNNLNAVLNWLRRSGSADKFLPLPEQHCTIVNIEQVQDHTMVFDLANGLTVRFDVHVYRR